MVDNTGTDAAPRSRAFVRWVLRGVAAQCFVVHSIFKYLFIKKFKLITILIAVKKFNFSTEELNFLTAF
jgi:hypothetical protein